MATSNMLCFKSEDKSILSQAKSEETPLFFYLRVDLIGP